MSILTVQRRLHERGRIRIGQKVTTKNGKQAPSKLDRFRFTSADKPGLEHAARLWGGQVAEWDSPNGKQWEVISETTDIPVVVPPADFGFSQFMEFWSKGGCQRRCDTATEMISGGSCLCVAEDEQVCKPTTRLSVILPDLPGLGLWRLETHGWNAAAELAGTVELLSGFGAGRLIPARLRLQQRSSITDGKTNRFAVPVLDLDVRLDELTASPTSVQQLVDPTTGEIGTGAPRFTPVPVAELAAGPDKSIRDQVDQVQEAKVRPARANGAQPIPSTGVRPRTAAQAAAGTPADRAEAAPATPVGGALSSAQEALIARARRLPEKLQERLNEVRQEAELPSLKTEVGQQQLAVWGDLIEGQEIEWSKQLRRALGKTLREAGLEDADRHAFVTWVTDGAAAGLTKCTVDQLLAVEVAAEALTSGAVTMAYDAAGVPSFTAGEAVAS